MGVRWKPPGGSAFVKQRGQAMKIVEIKEGELKAKAVEEKWTPHAVSAISKIAAQWLDTGFGCSSFSRKTNMENFMPICRLYP